MDIKNRLFRIIILGLVGVSVLGTLPQISEASPSEGFSERMQSLDEKESKAEEKLKDITLFIKETEEEAADMLKELELTAETLVSIQEEVELLSEQIDQREEQLKSQVRAVQITGQTNNVLKFLLEAESFSDVLGRLDVVNMIFSANQNLMEKQVEDKELVEVKERETVQKQEEQTLLAAKLESKKVELEEQKAEQEALIASIAAEKAELAEEREAYLAQQRESERRRDELQTARTAAEEATVISVSQPSNNQNDEVTTSSQSKTTAPANGSVISTAHSFTGVTYLYGGSTPAAFDCSGYTSYVYSRATGKNLARSAAGQFATTQRISQSEAQPGDLIFFNQSGRVDHVGIYLGGGRFIGAQTSTGVAVASFTSGYWSRYVAGFGRP